MKNKIRLSFQFFFLALILYVAARPLFDKSYLADFEKYCPYGGLSSLFSKLNQGTMACTMNETQVMLGLGLLLGAGLVGKLFCSFVCPIGTISEWIGRLGEKLHIRRDIAGIPDRALRGLKYILLFISIYFTMTSSELFCKKFDPYFAAVNLFANTDIVLFYAIPAFLITIAGALYFRLFWCKYLCPLGAFTNIFLNTVAAGIVILLYLVSNYFGAGLGYVWLLGGLVISGWVNESGFMKSSFLPIPKIIRSETACSSCGLCDVKCPQGINVSELPVVRHIDCNLCSDCVHSCPLKQTLSVTKKKGLKHLAPVTVVVLIALSLGMANFFDFATISLRWGPQPANLAVYSRTGIKTIKCYGSSMTLAGTLQDINGILGVDTYAKSHSVKIYYNPAVISENEVKALLFTPAKNELYEVSTETTMIGVLDIGINGLFDAIDYNNLSAILNSSKSIPGFETRYGEPVRTTIYFEKDKISQQKIIELLEQKHMTVNSSGGSETGELNFSPENSGTVKEYISGAEYKSRIFRGYDNVFSRYEDYIEKDLLVYVLQMPEAAVQEVREKLELFSAHLSSDEGIVRVSTKFDGEAQCCIYFDPRKTNEASIRKAMDKPKLTYFISENETESIDNMFTKYKVGKVVTAAQIVISSRK